MCGLVIQGPGSVYLLTAFPVAQGLTLGAAVVCVCITGEVHVPFGMQCLLCCGVVLAEHSHGRRRAPREQEADRGLGPRPGTWERGAAT